MSIKEWGQVFTIDRNGSRLTVKGDGERYTAQGGEQFLRKLSESWLASTYAITSPEERKKYEDITLEDLTSFPKFSDCYYRVIPDRCGGAPNPKKFFKGGEPTWSDIREGVPPPRDALWVIMEALFDEFANPKSPSSAYLVCGHAGTGKTTLLRSLSFMVARDFKIPVLVHIPGTPLHLKDVRPIVESADSGRLVVIIHDGAIVCEELFYFITEARKNKLPITILIEERTNQWNTAVSRFQGRFSPDVIELGPLSPNEIESILSALEKHKALGVLETADKATQVDHFTALAEMELLVALRELTTGTRFDEIVSDEFKKIPSAIAKDAYCYVAAVGQVDLYIRYSTLARLLRCDFRKLIEDVFKQTEGVLLSSEFVGKSRHTMGYKVRVRHPIIASIVFALAAPTDQDKYRVFNSIIEALDQGYQEDKSLLNELVRRREFVRTFANVDFQRSIYDRLGDALPMNPYVSQHRSILERELGDGESAIKYAREAVRLQPKNLVHTNTLGMALEFAARSERDLVRRKGLLLEAKSIFQKEIAMPGASAFSYLGMAYVKRQEYEIKDVKTSRHEDLLETLALLEQGREETDYSPIIEREYAHTKDQLGDRKDALTVLRDALRKDPNHTRLRDLYVKLLTEENDIGLAVASAREGLKYAPTDWRMYRHLGRLLERQDSPTKIVQEHYEGAIRNNRRDPDLFVELGAYLFKRSEYGPASETFAQAAQLNLTAHDKQAIRIWWKEGKNKRNFRGKISKIAGAGGFVQAIPENFEAFFWRSYAFNAELRQGDQVSFFVGFNTLGARALINGRN